MLSTQRRQIEKYNENLGVHSTSCRAVYVVVIDIVFSLFSHWRGESRFCFPPCMADLFCPGNVCQSFSIANFEKIFKHLVQLENCGLARLV